ncbi:transcriptional regulator SlyA [Lentilactobacillus sunkii]|uniref:Transcriptional regulator SlyA n=1 Tax=Lentilactobacillus sunkii TaxID=481719 RepID=A0A1E7XIE9_9LACO|nr:MarR family winged helix-turn-helix transcriptional regulator [Lentilactobacillus sunkii]OFA12847.1 transcriptional regulator SlyA [Lentilactobacillus sunkii]
MKDRNSVSSIIHQIAKLEESMINQQLHELNVNSDQAHTLRFIGDHSGTNQRSIATLLGRSAASVSNLLKGLESRQLIEKHLNPDNDREKQISLTPQGQKTVKNVNHAFNILDSRVDEVLSAPDQVRKQLNKIYQHLAKKE